MKCWTKQTSNKKAAFAYNMLRDVFGVQHETSDRVCHIFHCGWVNTRNGFAQHICGSVDCIYLFAVRL